MGNAGNMTGNNLGRKQTVFDPNLMAPTGPVASNPITGGSPMDPMNPMMDPGYTPTPKTGGGDIGMEPPMKVRRRQVPVVPPLPPPVPPGMQYGANPMGSASLGFGGGGNSGLPPNLPVGAIARPQIFPNVPNSNFGDYFQRMTGKGGVGGNVPGSINPGNQIRQRPMRGLGMPRLLG